MTTQPSEYLNLIKDDIIDLIEHYNTKEEKVQRLLGIFEEHSDNLVSHIHYEYLDNALNYHFLDNIEEWQEQTWSIIIGWW